MMDILHGKSAAKAHIPAQEIKTKDDWRRAKQEAAKLVEFFDKHNGSFSGEYARCFGLHHAQVIPEDQKPYNFFVVEKEMLVKDQDRDGANYTFSDRVIYNPEIITALETILQDAPKKDGKEKHKIAVTNIRRYQEACMSYKHRKAKKVDRFATIKVRYQTIGRFGAKKTHEEWIEGMKAHIFQHEVDHARGWDIFYGDGERKQIPLDDRLRENRKTKEDIEKEQLEEEKDWIEKIKNVNDYAIIEEVQSGDQKLLSLDEEMPEGYVEGSLETYYNKDGTIKEEYQDLPKVNSSKVFKPDET